MVARTDNVVYEEDNERREKGGAPLERFTIDLARQIVGNVIARIEEETVARKKKSDEDEIDALVEGLDEEDEDVEVDDDEDDEDVVEDDDDDEADDEDDDDEEEDPDEAPVKSRKSKSKSKSTKASKPKAEGIGTKEVAEEAGVDQRSLRMYLRAKGFQPKDDRDGRYRWKSLNDKEVQRIIKGIRSGELKKQQQEKLDDLKGRKAKKSTSKKTSAKSSKKRSKK